jgi:hypothetical protein
MAFRMQLELHDTNMSAATQYSLERVPGARPMDNRREARTVCQGAVHLSRAGDAEAAILAEVVDVSSSGFRASYRERSLLVGTEVLFRHKFFQGRARVMWSNPVLNFTHSGFHVLRDC